MTKDEQGKIRDLQNRMLGMRKHVEQKISEREPQMDYYQGRISTLNIIEEWLTEFGLTANSLLDRNDPHNSKQTKGESQ